MAEVPIFTPEVIKREDLERLYEAGTLDYFQSVGVVIRDENTDPNTPLGENEILQERLEDMGNRVITLQGQIDGASERTKDKRQVLGLFLNDMGGESILFRIIPFLKELKSNHPDTHITLLSVMPYKKGDIDMIERSIMAVGAANNFTFLNVLPEIDGVSERPGIETQMVLDAVLRNNLAPFNPDTSFDGFGVVLDYDISGESRAAASHGMWSGVNWAPIPNFSEPIFMEESAYRSVIGAHQERVAKQGFDLPIDPSKVITTANFNYNPLGRSTSLSFFAHLALRFPEYIGTTEGPLNLYTYKTLNAISPLTYYYDNISKQFIADNRDIFSLYAAEIKGKPNYQHKTLIENDWKLAMENAFLNKK